MSLRTFTTVAVDCNGCDEVLADVVPVNERVAKKTAKRLGWTSTEDGRDYCPACSRQRWTVAPNAEHAA